MDIGVTVTGALPAPVRLTVCGVVFASSIIFNVAFLVPDPVGVKEIDRTQLEPPVTVVQGLLVTAKSPALVPVIVTPLKCRDADC
jgi:hypothetical protein